MSAPLTINVAYGAYPPGVVLPNLGYDEYYWRVPKEEEEEVAAMVPEPVPEPVSGPVHSSEGLLAQAESKDPEEKDPLSDSDLSPRPSSSGTFTSCTPDSVSSPNQQLPSTPQGQKEKSTEKKGKTRIAFTQQQLQILQYQFFRQKYLSPQQIRELGSTLGLTYKQVKTWFQNQRMKAKRTQKEIVWMKNGICQPQNGYLDLNNQGYHQGYAIGEAKNYPVPVNNFHVPVNLHDGYATGQSYSQGQNFIRDHSQIYENPQNFHPFVSGEEWDGGTFGKAAPGACFGQPAIGYISQQKMNFYHGFSTSVEYATVKMEDGYPFPNVSATGMAFPSPPAVQHYQAPLQIPGAQSNFSA